jgi:hypothetical protein
MIDDRDICFATTTLYTECLEIQQRLIGRLFPQSERILIDGRDVGEWPASMFRWIEKAKAGTSKWTIHIDEDCFVIDRQAIEDAIERMESEGTDLLGCPDGYHAPRPCNPIVINPFFMICRTDALRKLEHDFSKMSQRIEMKRGTYMWKNSEGISFKHSYREGFRYAHEKNDMFSFEDGKEPYYPLFWHAIDIGLKLGYLYPHFDRELLSTNPMSSSGSREMAIHMWESRNMLSESRFYGKTAKERFAAICERLKKSALI